MNLIEGLQEEMNRCREVLKQYEDIGPVGVFGAAHIKNEIKIAEAHIANGDTIGMLVSLEDLQTIN